MPNIIDKNSNGIVIVKQYQLNRILLPNAEFVSTNKECIEAKVKSFSETLVFFFKPGTFQYVCYSIYICTIDSLRHFLAITKAESLGVIETLSTNPISTNYLGIKTLSMGQD